MNKNTTAINYLTCPKCGSRNIDEFRNAFWFMCRDCGHNGMPSSDEAKAVQNFLDYEKGNRQQGVGSRQ